MQPVLQIYRAYGLLADINISDRYIFLCIGISLLIPWLAIFYSKPQLRKKMIRAGLFGGLMAPPAEYWYFTDYWRPPGILGYKLVFIEDFLFGFTVTGLSAVAYEVAFNPRYEKNAKNYKKLFLFMFACGIALMMVLNTALGYNSMITSCICFLLFSTVVLILRPDLFKQSLISAFIMLLVVVVIYTPLFNIFNTYYWDRYWLLAETSLGVTFLGNLPLTELAWYFFWGGFAGIAHPFASGRVKIKAKVPASVHMA